MSSESVLLQTTHDHVRILTLNRPEKKNALSGELTRTLVAAIDDASSDPAVRVIGIYPLTEYTIMHPRPLLLVLLLDADLFLKIATSIDRIHHSQCFIFGQ